MALRRFAFTIAVIAVTLVIAAGCSTINAQTLQVAHELGTTTVPRNPQRVIVFDYGVVDSLDKLGIDVIGLPKANIPSYLSKFDDTGYANVGTLVEPDYEAVNALKPELIIISSRLAAHYDQLTGIAPTVYMGVDEQNYIASVRRNLRALGRIFDVEAAVETELANLEQTIERVRSLSSGKNALMLLVTGGRANAYGPGSRYGFVHEELGLTPVDTNIVESRHGQVISWEYVLVHDPDMLLVVDRDAVVAGGGTQTAKQVVENELVKFTKAYTTGNITYLDASYWYLSGGGLTSFAMMLEDIEQALMRAGG